MKRTFKAFKDLTDGDFRVLSSIEAGMRKGEYVSRDDLTRFTRMDDPDLEYHLGRLDEIGLTQRQGDPYEGYRLLHNAYDFLALNALVQRDVVESIGTRLAVGKESEVYEGLGSDGSEIVLKFHRLGISSFHKAVRLRGYLRDKHHFSWLYAARLAAEKEFGALTRLRGKVPVPCPIDQNRNTVVMSRFRGAELSDLDPEAPADLLDRLVASVKEIRKLGMVHGDLSEFNVLTDGDDYVVIDWPQWVETAHPQARAIYGRDVDNLLGFFSRKFPDSTPDVKIARVRNGLAWREGAAVGSRGEASE